jgi:hypothetical protein
MRINHHLAGLHLALAISVVSLVSACGGGSSSNGLDAGAGSVSTVTNPDGLWCRGGQDS